jgi:hypothetical protein
MSNSENFTHALSIAIQARVNTLVMGDPGGGKSALVYAISKKLGMHCNTFVGACRLPEDIGGYPVSDLANNRIKLLPVGDWLNFPEGKPGTLFIDEFGSNVPAMQAALMRVSWERKAGDVAIPDNISIVAAGNPPETAANANDIAAPLANRFLHLPWATDVNAVIQGFIEAWPEPKVLRLPANWQDEQNMVRSLVASFLRALPQHTHAVPKDESKRSEPWPSPRSWYSLFIPAVAAGRAAGASDDVIAMLGAGAVGPGVAQEFLSWLRKMDLPNPLDLLKDPKKFKLFDRQDKNFAVLNSVVAAALNDLSPENWVAAWTIMAHSAKEGHVDIATAAVRALARARKVSFPNITPMLKPFLPLLDAAGL